MWIAVAVLGVGLTTAMTITTTLLSQQPIALASEPLSAGNALAARSLPAAKTLTNHHRRPIKRHHRLAHTLTVSLMPRPAVRLPATTPPPAALPVTARARTVTTRRAPDGSSGDQGSHDGTQSQKGDVQAGQSGADD